MDLLPTTEAKGEATVHSYLGAIFLSGQLKLTLLYTS